MTKSTTMVTNNVFRFTKPFREGSSNMFLFSLQLITLGSYMTNHTTMVTSLIYPVHLSPPNFLLQQGYTEHCLL